MTSENVYTIGGVKVQFPVKPYPSQMAMMAQIVKGLQRRQNCLLESPTGSGKSLALLCSTLAWQRAEQDKADRYNDLIAQGITDPDILSRAAGIRGTASEAELTQLGLSQLSQQVESAPKPPKPQTEEEAAKAAASGGGFIPGDEDDDFAMPQNRFRAPRIDGDPSVGVGELDETLDETSVPGGAPPWAAPTRQPPRMKVPKIFFGTRTHKQIYQIVKELRRTSYKHVRSVVLSSREHTCIHPTVSKSRNKNEGCRELLDPNQGQGCRFNQGVARIKRHDQLAHFGLDTAWDIEDLVRLGKKIKACPYFAARSLMDTAEIVFCPYNYLIDPLIREAMSIDLKDQIIILDEAHNIEDSAREAASTTLTQDNILEAMNDLEKLASMKVNEEECKELAHMLSALSGWVEQYSDKLTDYTEFDRSGKIFTGTEMIAQLDLLGIGQDKLGQLKHCLNTITEDQDPEDMNPRISSNTSMLLKNLFLMYEFLFMDNMKYRNDYRIALVKAQTRKRAPNAGGWFGRRTTISWEFSINFWCLNPGVAFNSVGANVRCIILTSGTLSPMSSFQSELEVPFKIQLEANHVIDKNQVWVGTIGKGPTDQMLQATYRHTETWGFQDELGRLVLDVCRVIPRGVLCFLPSYAMLNKLLDRWQSTGVWEEINNIKIAMTEPRSGEEFEETMRLFYDTINDTKEKSESGLTGAFFMAVCRGKVSEGLDFTDDNARAVIAVGIPFPSVKDIQVDLKRQYNNAHCRTRGLLSGGDWYEIQAYRAVNQALGRCIRHRYDWGALILVDERYQRGSLATGAQQNKYTKGLSKWVRNKIIHQPSYGMALSSLRQFAENMTLNPPQKPESMNETAKASEESSNSNEDSMCDNSTKVVEMPKEASVSALISPLSLLVDGLGSTQDTTCIYNTDAKTELPEHMLNETGIVLQSQFSSTIVGSHNERQLDEDFCCTADDLVLPPSRLPFTSTQMSQSTNPKLPSSSKKDCTVVKEDVTLTSEVNSAKETLSSKLSQMLHADGTGNPAKKRRSFLLDSEAKGASNKLQNEDEPRNQSTLAADKEVYEFQYLDTKSKSNVSPLKELLETEIRDKSNKSLLQSKDGETGSHSKRSLNHEFAVSDDKKEESSIRAMASSPQMFDSDEDLFPDSSPKKVNSLESEDEANVSIVRKGTNVRLAPSLNISSSTNMKLKKTPKKDSNEKKQEKEEKKSVNQTKGCGKINCGKENSGCCKAARKRTLSNQNTSLQRLPTATGDDSDLEDFNLNQSYRSPAGEKLVRKVSKGRRSLSRRKGVQYSDIDNDL